MTTMQKIDEQLSRINEIREAETPGTYFKQRFAENAKNLSKRGELAARVEVINESLTAFAALLYEADTDGGFANIDAVTYRILIPAPFGSTGWKKWGLRAWESTELRGFLMRRATMLDKRPALFDYNDDSRTWHINITDYPTFDVALRYLQVEQMTVQSLRHLAGNFRLNRSKNVVRRKHTINTL